MQEKVNEKTFSGQSIYVGIDVHKKDWKVTVIEAIGKKKCDRSNPQTTSARVCSLGLPACRQASRSSTSRASVRNDDILIIHSLVTSPDSPAQRVRPGSQWLKKQ